MREMGTEARPHGGALNKWEAFPSPIDFLQNENWTIFG